MQFYLQSLQEAEFFAPIQVAREPKKTYQLIQCGQKFILRPVQKTNPEEHILKVYDGSNDR